MNIYGQRTVFEFVLRVLQKSGRNSPAAGQTIQWMTMTNARLGIQIPEDLEDLRIMRNGGMRIDPMSWISLLQNLARRIKGLRHSRPGAFVRNLQAVGKSLRLGNKALLILEFLCRVEMEDMNLAQLCRDLITDAGMTLFEQLALYCGTTPAEIMKRIGPESKLFKFGLVSNESGHEMRISVPVPMIKALMPPNRGLSDFRRDILGQPMKTDLAWEEFSHLGDGRDLVFSVLQGAMRSREIGVNILLHGPSGTGKTEFCKALASKLGMTLHGVGETDDDGDEPSRWERMTRLRLAQQLAAKDSLLLFDEMEDLQGVTPQLFPNPRVNCGSKVFSHRLLEKNPVPVLWTSNAIDSFDPAMLRRMTLVVEFKRPPARVRRTIWRKVLGENKLHVSSQELDILAREYSVAPGLAANAARVGRLTGGGLAHVRVSLEMMDKAMGGRGSRKAQDRPAFVPDLASTDHDLNTVTWDVRSSGRLDFSLLLFGPPGTGKSLYARHLAETLGLEVMHKRTSDMLSMYLGETEKSIARAFEEARQDQAMLVFDEADSLLRDRRGAVRSWEISQVNEMLTWMESHPLPFVCTTNLMESLDSASMRRFTFKIAFDYLSGDQAGLAFLSFFGFPPPAGIKRLRMLTPADYAVVKKKAGIQSCLDDPARLLAMLESEVAVKQGERRMGFIGS